MVFFTIRCSLVILLAGLSVEALTTVKYMSNYCNTKHSIFVNNSIVLKSTNQLLTDSPGPQLHCTSDLVTDTGSRLLIHFISLSISLENDTPDNLHIYDVDANGHAQMVTPASGLFGIYDKFFKRASMGVGDYISTGNRFRLTYVGSPTLTYRGFDILVTSVKAVNTDGSCPRLFGKCSGKHVCVPYSVWCDGEENCGEGDVSDEKSCNDVITEDWKYTYAITMSVVTAVIAIVLFLSTIGVVVCLLRKYNRRNYMRRMSIAVAAKKDGENWKITNDLGLTLSMAPPLYDDIVLPRQDEPPPSYDTLPFRQTTDVLSEEQNNAANECIVVACIENLNPSRGHTDDILCRGIAISSNSSEEEDADLEEDNRLQSSHLRKITNSSGSTHNLSSAQSSSKLCLEIDNVGDDESENDDENASVAKKNGYEEMCSNSSSQCSVETGFVSMGSSSSRNSGSEESPRHVVGASRVPLPNDKKDDKKGFNSETSLHVQYKNQTPSGDDEIKFIDELGEDSGIVN